MFGGLQSFPGFSRKTDVKGSLERCISIVVSQHEHQDHMDGSQKSKRIAKRPMDHVPEIQQLLRLRKEHDLLGKHHLFPDGRDGIFHRAVSIDICWACSKFGRRKSDSTSRGERTPRLFNCAASFSLCSLVSLRDTSA